MRRRDLAAAFAALPLLAACTRGDPAPAASSAPRAGSSDGGSSAGASAAKTPGMPRTMMLHHGSDEVTVTHRSLVRSRGYLVLTLDLELKDPAGELPVRIGSTVESMWSGDGSDARDLMGLRLVDLDGDRVASPALDADGRTVRINTGDIFGVGQPEGGETSATMQVAYGDLEVDAVTIYLPKLDLALDVPVEDGDVPSILDLEPLALDTITEAPVESMLALSVDLVEPVRETSDADGTTVSLGSDVLFASSSADLDPAASQIIADAVATLTRHEPGDVSVVGHTDSVDDDAFNLDLSRRRARAVADALTAALGPDLDGYPLTVDGKGESMPIADNSTTEGKALNRRVELTIRTPLIADEAPQGTEPYPFDGATAHGSDPVTDEDGKLPLEIRATDAQMISGHLVVTTTLTVANDQVDSIFGPANQGGQVEMPGGLARGDTHGGVCVIDGSTAYLPVVSAIGGPEQTLRPLTDINTKSRIDGGVPRIVTLVYPRDTPVGPEVTIQLIPRAWRITGIPVGS